LSLPKASSWLFLILLGILPAKAQAVCKGMPLNPITDVCWSCIFPITIAGITVSPSPTDYAPSSGDMQAKSPICVCPTPIGIPRPGIPISFWEPARFIEVVKDPFCFPSIGTGLSPLSPGLEVGKVSEVNQEQEHTASFYQGHYAIFPVWTILELFTDLICVESSGFDVAYISEVDPTWQNDALAMIIYPETLLFGNLPAQLACMPDSIAANAGRPLSPLYWCMGSWGSTYPMSGTIGNSFGTEASLGVGARLLYKMARIGSVCDTGVNICTCVPTPIWIKGNYRFSIAKPVAGWQGIPIGRTSMIWGSLKNPPLGNTNAPDNFLYILFRKRTCCAF